MQMTLQSFRGAAPFKQIIVCYFAFLVVSMPLLTATLFFMGVNLKLSTGVALIYTLSYLAVGQVIYLRNRLILLTKADELTQLRHELGEAHSRLLLLEEETHFYSKLPTYAQPEKNELQQCSG